MGMVVNDVVPAVGNHWPIDDPCAEAIRIIAIRIRITVSVWIRVTIRIISGIPVAIAVSDREPNTDSHADMRLRLGGGNKSQRPSGDCD